MQVKPAQVIQIEICHFSLCPSLSLTQNEENMEIYVVIIGNDGRGQRARWHWKRTRKSTQQKKKERKKRAKLSSSHNNPTKIFQKSSNKLFFIRQKRRKELFYP